MNLIEELIKRGLAKSDFHASGMLNVLDCVKLDTDEQRIARCELYDGWKKYYKNSKEFTNAKSRKAAARKNAIAGLAVPELPMLEVLPKIGDVFEFDYVYDERGKVAERVIVVDVTDEHVFYKMPGVSVNKIFPMTHEYWLLNQDERRFVEHTTPEQEQA